MFQVTGARDKIIRFDIRGERVLHWQAMNPVYACLDSTDNYFPLAARDSVDNQLSDVIAWNGAAVRQDVTEPWNYIKAAWLENPRTYSFVFRVPCDKIVVAMRTPYLARQLDRLVANCSQSKLVKSHVLGRTPEGRIMRIIEICDGPSMELPCILVYAREHANEQDGSWAIDGIATFLLSDSESAVKLRHKNRFLLIPILDLDGAAHGIYQSITGTFADRHETVESRLYANWFAGWIDSGHRIDCVLDIHNVESSEGAHIFSPLLEPLSGRRQLCQEANAMIFSEISKAGYNVQHNTQLQGYSPTRLGGWLQHYFGSLLLPFELNAQERHRHLNASELRELGRHLITGASAFIDSPKGKSIRENSERLIKSRNSARTVAHGTPDDALYNERLFAGGEQIYKEAN